MNILTGYFNTLAALENEMLKAYRTIESFILAQATRIDSFKMPSDLIEFETPGL